MGIVTGPVELDPAPPHRPPPPLKPDPPLNRIGGCQRMGCSPAGVAVKPTPVSVRPETVRPVMAWMPGVARPGPLGVAAFQAMPSGEVQTTTSLSPAVAPNVPVTVKPPPAAATALTCAVPAGTGRGVSVQARPPSADR